MQKQRIFISVVGFSDVERHALNTVFRLSEDRDLSYAPWTPSAALDTQLPLAPAQVLLVDGASVEGLLTHARELPVGQRLIWVGADAPPYAWRVLERPIAWSDLLHDLDAVYAAHRVDSGYLDLDISAPVPLAGDVCDGPGKKRRALLVGLDAADTEVLRSALARVPASAIDVVCNTDLAVTLMGRHAYGCGVFNLDEHQVDVWALAQLFRTRFPQAKVIALSEAAGPLGPWWRRRRVRRSSEQVGVSALLARPLQAGDFTP